MTNMEPTAIPVACPGCKSSMGELVQVDGTIYLDTGQFLALAGKGHCHRCGRPFHFRPPKKTWQQLVAIHYQSLPVLNEGS